MERFAFGPQFFATQQLAYEHLGRLLPGGDPATGRPSHLTLAPGPDGNVVSPGETANSVAPDGQSVDSFTGPGPFEGTGFGVSRLFATGGALLLQFANQTVFEFSGPFEGTYSQSDATLQLVQPLLQGGGRAVTLEPLTQTERNLLYEVRSYARFQREFYAGIATGDRLTQGARLEASQNADEDDDGVRPRIGLLPLIEQLQVLRNEVRNLELLEAHLRRFEALQKAEEVSLIQLDQVRQDVAQAQARVIRARRRYFANFDRFKIQLGLPTNLPLVLDPSVLAQFQLDPETCELPKLAAELQDLNLSAATAEDIALENRLDLMNQRAALVDYWRKIRVAANGLMGVLDVQYEGSWLTPDPNVTSRPFDFDGRRSAHRIRLNGELPLVRIRERNIYRGTLIEYQQARRRLMLAEDTVRLEVRNSLREFMAARETFAIQYKAVQLACQRVDQTRKLLDLPPRPGEARELGTNSARNLLESQQDLVDAQNDLVQAWVDCLIARIRLQRDLGILDVNSVDAIGLTGFTLDGFTPPANDGLLLGNPEFQNPEFDNLVTVVTADPSSTPPIDPPVPVDIPGVGSRE
ncbi:MAG: TolC family protein [Planctomycetales bacterium]|nr:TolC family protein [Planctomycetales bacterium]